MAIICRFYLHFKKYPVKSKIYASTNLREFGNERADLCLLLEKLTWKVCYSHRSTNCMKKKCVEKKNYHDSAAAAKSLQSCPTLCDPIDGSLPGSPVPGILQARTLEWVAISFSNAWKWEVKVKSLNRVRHFATPWTAAYQWNPKEQESSDTPIIRSYISEKNQSGIKENIAFRNSWMSELQEEVWTHYFPLILLLLF